MQTYEVAIIIDALLDDKDVEGILQKIRDIIQSKKGKIEDEFPWTRKKLAYPIEKKTHGYYHFFYLNGTQEMLDELNRQCSYDTLILKCYIVKIEDTAVEKSRFEALVKNPMVNVELYNQSSTEDE